MGASEIVAIVVASIFGICGTAFCAYKWHEAEVALEQEKRKTGNKFQTKIQTQDSQNNKIYRDIGRELFETKNLSYGSDFIGEIGSDSSQIGTKIPGIYVKRIPIKIFSREPSQRSELFNGNMIRALRRSDDCLVFSGITREEVLNKLNQAQTVRGGLKLVPGVHVANSYKHVFLSEPCGSASELCTIEDAERYLQGSHEDQLFSEINISREEFLEKLNEAKADDKNRAFAAECFNRLAYICGAQKNHMNAVKDEHPESLELFYEMLGKFYVGISNEPVIVSKFRDMHSHALQTRNNESTSNSKKEDAEKLLECLDKISTLTNEAKQQQIKI